ncbi:MAG: hypothetical protein ACI9HI_000353 [Salinirussus sp.]|jgi:hypothetical protein
MKDSFTAAVTAVLGLLAVGFAAATLTTTNSSGGAGSGSGPGSGGGAIPFPEREPASPAPTDIPFAEFMLLALVLALVALLVYAAVFRRALFRRLVAVAVPFVLAGVVAYLLLVVLGDLSGSAPAQPAILGNGSTPGGPPGDGGSSDPSSPLPLGPLAVLGVALVGVALVVVRARGGSRGGGASDDAPDPDSDRRAAVGRAAGRAADRLEEGGDNEVYRAWREMTDLLDVEDPETSTPGEFADAAVDAGLGGEAVHELTRLFEDVRYGDTPPTDSEDRAVAVFRQIEEQYAETAEDGATEGEA